MNFIVVAILVPIFVLVVGGLILYNCTRRRKRIVADVTHCATIFTPMGENTGDTLVVTDAEGMVLESPAITAIRFTSTGNEVITDCTFRVEVPVTATILSVAFAAPDTLKCRQICDCTQTADAVEFRVGRINPDDRVVATIVADPGGHPFYVEDIRMCADAEGLEPLFTMPAYLDCVPDGTCVPCK